MSKSRESSDFQEASHMESEKKLDGSIHMEDQVKEYNKYEYGEKSDLAKQLNRHVAVESDDTGSKVQLTSHGCDSISRSMSNETKILHSPPPSYCGSNTTMMSLNDISPSGKAINNVVSSESNRNDFCNLYIKDLRYETRRQFGLRLDLEFAGVPNWKSVADAVGFTFLEIQNFQQEKCKTEHLLVQTQVRFPDVTVGHLIEILHELDREDVITDMEPWFKRDVERLVMSGTPGSSMSSMPRVTSTPMLSELAPSTEQYMSKSIIAHPTDTEKQPIPVQDHEISTSEYMSSKEKEFLQNSSSSYQASSFGSFAEPEPLKPPSRQYDAFVLYDVADKDFILKEFLPKIEEQAGISLFIPDRDLDAGEQSYYAQLEAMINRCPKLVVILSDEFLTTPASQWGLNVGVSIDPAARRRKIIPVIYKRITKMNILGGISTCDRTRVLEDDWFWNGIIRSLKNRA